MKCLLIIAISLIFAYPCFGSEVDPTSSDALDFDIDSADELDNDIDTYETIGNNLSKFYAIAQDKCQQNIIKNDKLCDELKKKYNKLRGVYIKAGNLIIEGIKDDSKKERNIKRYRTLKMSIVKQLKELCGLIGVNYEQEKEKFVIE